MKTLNLKIRKLNDKAVVPSYATAGDAGLDLTATHIVSQTDDMITYGTGISVEIPLGYVGYIFPRSSIRKYDLTLSNSVGVIDSGYRGEICFSFRKVKVDGELYKPGDRVGQLILMEVPYVQVEQVESLSMSDRGVGGFGSTGN